MIETNYSYEKINDYYSYSKAEKPNVVALCFLKLKKKNYFFIIYEMLFNNEIFSHKEHIFGF